MWRPRSNPVSAAGGMTMLIATHEMGFAREIASCVCFLDAG
jgi:polar amino acid transport system ATP-binding protein